MKGVLDKNKIIRHEVSSGENLIEKRFDVFASTEINEEQVENIKKLQSEIFVTFRDHVLKHRESKFEKSNYE